MKITTLSLSVPFAVERSGADGKTSRVGVAIGWGLTTAGFAVPVFANQAVALQHGDRAVVSDDMKLLIGLVEREGEPLIEPRADNAKGPGRPPKPKAKSIPLGPYSITFGSKTYKLTSSWHFKDDDTEFVFQLPGDANAPDDERVQKVNRDGFVDLSKRLPTKSYDVVLGLKPDTKPEPTPEPETQSADQDALDLV